ncbi:Uncharacterised protein [Clostridioides difficile]|nr:Uncharacterised protein [Clostridioides difficile]VIG68935.1 Uncharacterised protein [Clostridioides difficile]
MYKIKYIILNIVKVAIVTADCPFRIPTAIDKKLFIVKVVPPNKKPAKYPESTHHPDSVVRPAKSLPPRIRNKIAKEYILSCNIIKIYSLKFLYQ